MRRKSERTAGKKTKSPEKKIEKVKRTRTRRRKQSTSSDNDSGEESAPMQSKESVIELEKIPPGTPVKEDSPEDGHDQVWHVKATEASGDVGEIQKLKICLTRPPSTPERVDRSPRSKRKHSRATSSSDTPSNEGEERKKSKHRSKRATRGSKDDFEKNHDSQEEGEVETESSHHSSMKSDNDISQSSDKKFETVPDDTPMSTTNEEAKSCETITQLNESVSKHETSESAKADTSQTSDADTTVASPKVETTVVSTGDETNDDKADKSAENESVKQCKDSTEDKSEVLELHDEDNRCESLDTEVNESKNDLKQETKSENIKQDKVFDSKKQKGKSEDTKLERKSDDKKHEERSENTKQDGKSSEVSNDEKKQEETKEDQKSKDTKEEKPKDKDQEEEKTSKDEVSKSEGKTEDRTDNAKPCDSNEVNKSSDESHVVESSETNDKKVRKASESRNEAKESTGHRKERSDSTHSQPEDNTPNGSSAPIVISRKRRWGSRPTKIQTQKSITISTDVLKDIIPDVKPVEFDEVIEDKKSKREVTEKIERPVLPKIVIDNTESIELNKKASEDIERDIVKPRDSHLTSNRKISIVKDNDSIIARPPSPPRHKQSCILFITNLVRPFTLPQLKNLLQRTGRIAEDGFWIDRIKSKCYVKYECEDQAVETRHALHGVTWPVSNPKTLQVDFSNEEAFEKAKLNEDTDNAQVSTIPGTVEDWLREQDMKRERGELEKPYERKAVMREWDVGKNDKDKDKIRRQDERPIGLDKRRHRTPERSPEPARKFKKKEEEAPAKLLDDLFRKTKTTPCIYWLPLSAETIAIKEEQRRQHMAEHERRLQELRRTHRRH